VATLAVSPDFSLLQRVEKRVQNGRRVALTKRMVDAHRRRQLVGKALGRGMALIA
jgi:hypothetical protein